MGGYENITMIDFKERIEKTGLKQSFLYPKIKVSQSVFSQFLNGERKISYLKRRELDYILTQYEKIRL